MVDMKSVNKLRKQMLESEFDDIEKYREGIWERRSERFDDLRDYLAEPTPVEDMTPFGQGIFRPAADSILRRKSRDGRSYVKF